MTTVLTLAAFLVALTAAMSVGFMLGRWHRGQTCCAAHFDELAAADERSLSTEPCQEPEPTQEMGRYALPERSMLARWAKGERL